ncbi:MULTISPECIES: hypothetical protein [Corynebacterium]|nr:MULTISPECIES: hypothetical protein [Corynebacterium]
MEDAEAVHHRGGGLEWVGDGAAKEYRQLDTKIQQLNWSTELR